MQVVHEVAAPHDQHALVAQRRELLRGLEMPRGGLGLVDAELDDRNVRFGIDVHEHRPGAVIEAPAAIHRDVHGREQLRDARRKLGGAGRGILHVVQLAAEIRRSRGWCAAVAIAVTAVAGRYQCAETQRMARGRGSAAPIAAQPARPRVLLDRVHRVAVAEEHRRHARLRTLGQPIAFTRCTHGCLIYSLRE